MFVVVEALVTRSESWPVIMVKVAEAETKALAALAGVVTTAAETVAATAVVTTRKGHGCVS